MKKILAVLSVALFVVGIAACGGKKAEETTPENAPAEQAQPAEQQAAPEQGGEEQAQPAEQQEQAQPAEQQEQAQPAEQQQGGDQGGEQPMAQ